MVSGVRVAVRRLAVLSGSLTLLFCTALSQTAVSSDGMGFSEARHLLARTGFGVAVISDISGYASLTREEAVVLGHPRAIDPGSILGW